MGVQQPDADKVDGMMIEPVGSHQVGRLDSSPERPGGTAGVARGLRYGVREGGDGDEVSVDAEVLFQFLDEQSRSLRDFLRSAREL